MVGCKLMAIAWGRYHRAADRFIDADPAPQGVEEEEE